MNPLLCDALHEEENTNGEKTTPTDSPYGTSVFAPEEHAHVHSKHVKSTREIKEMYGQIVRKAQVDGHLKDFIRVC